MNTHLEPALDKVLLEPIVQAALVEDLGRRGDVTSQATIPAERQAKLQIRARQAGVICGMDVAPGEIIHMDENGAVKFPANRMADVLENVQKLIEHEGTLQERIKKATSAAEIRKAHRGEEYGDEN